MDAVRAAPDAAAWAIAGVVPKRVVAPSSVAELATAVADVAAAGEALVPFGRGAHRGLGHAPARYDVALVTERLAAIRDHQPADMTVTVEAGVTLAELDATLAGAKQWLPIDPALPAATTVGGLLAADLAGSLAASQGRVRDYLIGVTVVGADGVVTRAGGRVVKNVAGYDLMKLYVGSLGTLAVLAEATFKVRPRPAAEHCLVLAARDIGVALAFGAAFDAERIGALAVTVTGGIDREPDASILVRLGGVAADVRGARARVTALAARHAVEVVREGDVDDAAVCARLEAVRDFPAGAGDVVARIAALPTRVPTVVAAARAAVGGCRGAWQADPLRGVTWLRLSSDSPAAALAALAAAADAHAARLVVERWPAALADTVTVWHPLPPAFSLMQRMKQALDPNGTLAPGRFVGRL